MQALLVSCVFVPKFLKQLFINKFILHDVDKTHCSLILVKTFRMITVAGV